MEYVNTEQNVILINSFLLDCSIRNFSQRTIQAYKSHVRYFLSLNSVDVTRQDLANFLVLIRDKKGLSASTVENYFTTLSCFYEFLMWEGIVPENPIPAFRKRYLHYYKTPRPEERQLISLEQMRALILFPEDIMWKTIFCMYAKTGMRRQELIDLDEEDLQIRQRRIYLKKHHPKRSNCILFIDDELYFLLEQWMKKRHNNGWNKKPWLFRGTKGKRITRDLIYDNTIAYAQALGFHDPAGRLEEKFTPHCMRHFFTTMMLRAGCPREYVQELRGDIRTEAIDIYHHIVPEELKEIYLKYVFKFGIKI